MRPNFPRLLFQPLKSCGKSGEPLYSPSRSYIKVAGKKLKAADISLCENARVSLIHCPKQCSYKWPEQCGVVNIQSAVIDLYSQIHLPIRLAADVCAQIKREIADLLGGNV